MAHDHFVNLIGWYERALLIGMARLSSFRLATQDAGRGGWRTRRIGGGRLGGVARGLLELGFELAHAHTQVTHHSDQRQKRVLDI